MENENKFCSVCNEVTFHLGEKCAECIGKQMESHKEPFEVVIDWNHNPFEDLDAHQCVYRIKDGGIGVPPLSVAEFVGKTIASAVLDDSGKLVLWLR